MSATSVTGELARYFWPITSHRDVNISARDWQHVFVVEDITIPPRKIGLITGASELNTKGIFLMNGPVIVREPLQIPKILSFYNGHHRSAKIFAGEKIAELVLVRI